MIASFVALCWRMNMALFVVCSQNRDYHWLSCPFLHLPVSLASLQVHLASVMVCRPPRCDRSGHQWLPLISLHWPTKPVERTWAILSLLSLLSSQCWSPSWSCWARSYPRMSPASRPCWLCSKFIFSKEHMRHRRGIHETRCLDEDMI